MSNDIGPSSPFLNKGVGNGIGAAGPVRASKPQHGDEVDFASLMAPQPDTAKLDARVQAGTEEHAKKQDTDEPAEQKNSAHVTLEPEAPKAPDAVPDLPDPALQTSPKGISETIGTGQIHDPHERLFKLNVPKDEQPPNRLLTPDNTASKSKISVPFEQTALVTHQSSAGHFENATAIAKATGNPATLALEETTEKPAAPSTTQATDNFGTRLDTHLPTKAGVIVSNLTQVTPHKQPVGAGPLLMPLQSSVGSNSGSTRSSKSISPVEKDMPELQQNSNRPHPVLDDARPTVAAKPQEVDHTATKLAPQTSILSASVAVSRSVPRTVSTPGILTPTAPERKDGVFAVPNGKTSFEGPLPPASSGADSLIKSPIKAATAGSFNLANPASDTTQSALLFTETLETQSWDSARLTPITNTPLSLARADIAQHVARQLVDVLPHSALRPVEIALSPQELGRVRMSVHTEDGAITVNIIAERAETLDLMRRHIDQLGQTFRAMGYASISFAFGAGGGADKQTNDNENSTASNQQSSAKSMDHPEPDLILIDPASSTGVDIRL